MRLSEYLEQRTRNGKYVKALTHAEASLCGVPWPLRSGWPQEFADLEVDADAMHAAVAERRRKKAERKKHHEVLSAVPKKERKHLRKKLKQDRKQNNQLSRRKVYAATDGFLCSYEWRVIRMKVLIRDGRKCACCGATPDDGLKMHVDHIKPRKTHPELALDLNNLQVLCEVCNHGKGNWDSTDWRRREAVNDG